MKRKRLPREIFSIQFLVLISYSSIAVLTLLPLFFEHLGGNPRRIGFLVGLFSLAAFLSRPLVGWILSRVNPKNVLLLGLILLAVTTGLYFFIQSLNWLVVLIRISQGIGFSFFILAALLIVVMVSPEEERAYAIGVVSTGFMFPLLIIPYLSEQIIERYGYFFFFLAAFSLALIPLLYAFFMKLKLPSYSDSTEVESAGLLRLLRRKRIFMIFLLTFIFEIGLSASLSFVPLLAHESSSMRSGYYYTFLGLTAVFMRLFAGKRFKYWGNPLLIVPAFCFISAGGVLIYFSHTNLLLGVAGVIWGVGVGILYPHLSAMIVEGSSIRQKGNALSLFASSVDLGFAFGPLFFGWVSQYLGLRIAFVPLALCILFSSLVLIWAGKNSLFEMQHRGSKGQIQRG